MAPEGGFRFRHRTGAPFPSAWSVDSPPAPSSRQHLPSCTPTSACKALAHSLSAKTETNWEDKGGFGTLQKASRSRLAHLGLGCPHSEKVRGKGLLEGQGWEGYTPNGGPTWGLESQPCQCPGRGAQPGPDDSEPLGSPAWRLVAENGDARVWAAVGLQRPSGQGSRAPGWEVLSEK